MSTFRLPLAVPERKDPNIAAQEDNALCIEAFSPRRTKWQLVCAFLDAGYGDCKYQMFDIYDNSDGTLEVRLVNFRNSCLLYGQAFQCGCEMVVFTGSNIFTNYRNRFPKNDNFIHSVLPEPPMAPEVPPHFLAVPLIAQEVPPPYLEVQMSQELALSLELSLELMSQAVASGAD